MRNRIGTKMNDLDLLFAYARTTYTPNTVPFVIHNLLRITIRFRRTRLCWSRDGIV